ncbi:MAG: hypothetical protein CMJ49_02680 [Planctomycetaceae bacterium]|nr:hypothetical protein [Planctomycetaceae bacterium]
MAETFDQRLAALGLALPAAPKPVAAYVPVVQTGNLVFISGQLPLKDGRLEQTGRVPSQVTVEQAKVSGTQAALNLLAVLGSHLEGDWTRLKRIVRLGIFVQSDDGFHDQAIVGNSVSELMEKLFGNRGKHARATVGVNALPLDSPVEVELVAEVG